jgi:outer membrane protein assembly factor BamB
LPIVRSPTSCKDLIELRREPKTGGKKMKNVKEKTAIAFALFLIATIAASMMLVQNVNAHTPPWTIRTYAYINAEPNPVGVGQQINIIMWLDKILDGAAVGNDIRWHNYNLTITKPDNSVTSVIFPTCQDTTSAQFYAYTPSQTGNYTFTFSFPGQKYTYHELIFPFAGPPDYSAFENDTYLPSTASCTVTVQQEQVPVITSYPLPTNYWTRPIYSENTDWWSISSNWLGTGSPQFTVENSYTNKYIPDAIGPLTSHIMWTKPLQSGGVVGGNNFEVPGVNYFEGSAYLNRYTNPIIMDGMLFYTEPISFSGVGGFGGGPTGPTNCVNLRTGELIWSRSDVPAPSFGLIFDLPPGNPNQHGVFPPVLVATTGGLSFFGPPSPYIWMLYDADTGDWIMNWTDVPSSASNFMTAAMGAPAMGPQGEYLIYFLANDGTNEEPQWYISEWNSTNVFYFGGVSMLGLANFGTADAGASIMYDWNASVPTLDTMAETPTVIAAYYDDLMLCYTGALPSGGSPAAFGRWSDTPYTYFAINLNASKGTLGSVLWSTPLQPPANNITVFSAGVDPVGRIFVESHKETRQWVAYDLDTGKKIWGPSGNEPDIDYYANDFGGVPDAQLAYGNLYYSGFGGVIYCYDEQTGNVKWTYGNGGEGNSTNSGAYTGYGDYPTFITAIANGVIYTETTEHTILNPIYKGALTRAVNATDGTEIWTLSDYTGGGGGSTSYAIADGFATFYNGYDNQIYVVGRGPSATTVTAPTAGLAFGQSVVISGTVTDISAGTKQDQQAADFPNGVPCVSDESMKDWMGYVYQQRPLPADAVGVDVTLSVLDSNNNCYEIGTATTDANGFFRYTWVPIIPGDYTVYASFAGTNAYWPSQAEAAFTVMEAPEATPPPTPTPAPMTDAYVLGTGITAIVAIVIIGLVIILMLRKR